jgi:WD40 repeat protein
MVGIAKSDGEGFPTLPQSGKPDHPEDTNFLVDNNDYEIFLGADNTNASAFLGTREPVYPTELEKGMQLKEEARLEGHTSKISSSCFSFDGSLFASGGYDKKIIVWRPSNRASVGTFEGHSYVITDVRFSNKQNLLASASLDKTICLWDCDEFRTKAKLTGHTAAVTSVDFHPIDSDALCSTDEEGNLKIWKISTRECTFSVKESNFKQARFHPVNGRYIAAGVENAINLYELGPSGPSVLAVLKGHDKAVNTISWSPSGDYLLTASDDVIRVWDSSSTPPNYKCIKSLPSHHANKFNCCTFHPRMTSVVVIGSYQTICLWNFDTDRTSSFSVHEGIVSSLSSSPAAGLLASTSHDAKIKLWS